MGNMTHGSGSPTDAVFEDLGVDFEAVGTHRGYLLFTQTMFLI